jgi:hypothetical protein
MTINTAKRGTTRKGVVFMANPPRDSLDRIEYLILKILAVLLVLIAAAKLFIGELKSLF